MGFATNAIHVGQEPDPATGAIVAPIYQTSTYVQEEFGKYRQGYDYARTNHPNRKALEKTLAKLEGGHAAYAFSSGMAAMAKLATERNATLVVDNTFLSPYLQRPIELGAHIVVHSMTKYLNGHSDSTGGAVILTRPEDAEKIYFVQRSAGTGLSPMDCFLVSRGIKTLAVRMLQHNANGIAVARHLDAHPKVQKVYYPGLPSHPQHNLARSQQRGPGAMLSFDVGSAESARRLLNKVKLCALAESLGGVETLISLPAVMTHASMPKEVRDRVGITEGLVRLSVGIEDVEDIIADLDQALLYV